MKLSSIVDRDRALKAKAFADKLAKANGYEYTEWLKGRGGFCKAGFSREGQFWSLSFSWQPSEGFEQLQYRIEHLNFLLIAAQRDFAALQLGAAMAAAGHSAPVMGNA